MFIAYISYLKELQESPAHVNVSPQFSRRLSSLNGLGLPPTLETDVLNNEGLLVSLGGAASGGNGQKRRMSAQVQSTYATTTRPKLLTMGKLVELLFH